MRATAFAYVCSGALVVAACSSDPATRSQTSHEGLTTCTNEAPRCVNVEQGSILTELTTCTGDAPLPSSSGPVSFHHNLRQTSYYTAPCGPDGKPGGVESHETTGTEFYVYPPATGASALDVVRAFMANDLGWGDRESCSVVGPSQINCLTEEPGSRRQAPPSCSAAGGNVCENDLGACAGVQLMASWDCPICCFRPGQMCKAVGEACTNAAECCDGGAVACTAGRCTSTPPTPPPPSEPCGILFGTTALGRGGSVRSCDGRSLFVHQFDGNVVLYHDGAPLWATRTGGRATQILEMQLDGDLVLYAPDGTRVWSTATAGHEFADLDVGNDCGLTISAPTASGSFAPIWTSGTAGCVSALTPSP